MWPGGTLPMLLIESSCVYIYIYIYIISFGSVVPRVCLTKVPFLAFLA